MNRLDPSEDFDDAGALDALGLNTRLKSYPDFATEIPALKAGYIQYAAASGNAHAILKVPLPDAIQAQLKSLYVSPSNELPHINRMRAESDANCCPMCGSFHSGTLDHLLPKTDYPEFAIFGRNLVPACKCNSKRSTLLIGPNPGERILHPYYDDILGERLFVARFDDPGSVPRITLRPLLEPHDPNHKGVRFHMANIVERTSIMRYLKRSWMDMLRRPSLTAAELRNAPAIRQDLEDILALELDRQDDTHGSKNNWRSVFIAGLLDDPVLDWLIAAFQRPNYKPDGPLLDGIV
jgi:hypothetical protein